MKAINVKPLPDYKIEVAFEDGISGIIALSDLIQKGIFTRLRNEEEFKKVYIDGAAIAWSDELEIDADNIYAEILNTSAIEILHNPVYHAAD